MTRKKVKLAYIVNDSARKATYKKRKKGLLKKVDELTTLCGIEACAIIYSPFEPQPEVWPSPWGVQKVLSKLRTMPELEQSKKMVNQETFLKQRILKAKEQVMKLQKENREKEITQLMFKCLGSDKVQFNNLSATDLNDLAWMIDQNLKHIKRMMEKVGKNDQMNQGRTHMVAPTTLSLSGRVPKNEEIALEMMNGNGNEAMQFGETNLIMGFDLNPLLF
ncbi:hypothetical protein TanjilG_02736 [Lupinus angustifolius]|uniref:MADS-box domain-containing protein n=1 Tax=Lupinus angustifolius TaxID=3871 RepID=A0A4P1RBS1_LUPAN|nr:PREDICTED: agamous-like MADS-box protein AGL80 [Lupinus angustifolius]OIW07102.1 hypothetical protein TanjilG_02736 [Lupinus angustifolius]